MDQDVRSRLGLILGTSMERARTMVRERFLAIHGPGELRVVLWGAGELARVAIAGLRKAGLAPLAICDRNPARWHSLLEGIEILPPATALARFGEVASFVPAVYTNRLLLEELAKQGVRAMPLAMLAWQFPEAMLPHCALDLPFLLHQEAASVMEAMDLWADDASRREFLGQVKWRTDLDISLLPPGLRPEAMFHPSELFEFLPEEYFVDCGAFDGDSIRNHLAHHPEGSGPITAIEPDPLTFRRLANFLESLAPVIRSRVQAVQVALGSRPGEIPFQATGGVASSTASGGQTRVRVERLDDLEAAKGATFLKMDIEGAESEALAGAARLIREARPVLGICLYHHTADLWRIPLLIHSISPDHRLFLRRYSDECWEQVCYAIPPERLRT